jgi:hypothetical protein
MVVPYGMGEEFVNTEPRGSNEKILSHFFQCSPKQRLNIGRQSQSGYGPRGGTSTRVNLRLLLL